MRPIRTSITAKLMLLFLSVGIVSVSLIGTYSFYTAKKALIRRTIDHLISVRTAKKQQVEYFFEEKSKNLEILCNRNDLHGILSRLNSGDLSERNEIRSSARDIVTYYRDYNFSNAYLVACRDTSFVAVSLNDPFDRKLPGNLMVQLRGAWNRNKTTDSTLVGDLFPLLSGNFLPVCLVSRRIMDDQGKILGMVAMEISSDGLNHIMLQNNEKIGLGKSGEAYIVGKDLLMRSSSRFIRNSVLNIRVNTKSAREALQNMTGAIETSDYRDIPVFSAYEPLRIPGLNWIVLAEMDYAEAIVPVTQLRNDIFLVAVVISLFILGIARLIIQMITNPLIRLQEAALRLGKGDYSRKVDIKSHDEIGSLAQSFNRMTNEIREERRRRISSVYDGQEMERQRFSRDLHDGLGQRLMASKLMLESMEEKDHAHLPETLDELRNVFTSLADEIHQISSDLMPPALMEFGLEIALSNLCEEVRTRSRMEVEFYSHGFCNDPNEKAVIYLYRIAQEGISNILKHAEATSFSLQLVEDKENIILILEDNGKGFPWDPDSLPSGNGLSNIRERTALLDGLFNLESNPGQGTTLRIKIPRKR